MSVAVDLHAEERGEGSAVCLLHGLIGQLANWRSIARELAEDYRVVSVDLRNHGRSPHARPHDWPSMVADVAKLLRDRSIERPFVVGHSMGGRVAMSLALTAPESIAGIVGVDISPFSIPGGEVRGALDALFGLDPSAYGSRREIDAALAGAVPDDALRGSLLMNLARAGDGFSWRMGVEEIRDSLADMGAPPSGERRPYEGPALFLRGGRSDYFPREHEERTRELFPRMQVVEVEGAGHLVHIDRPEAFLEALRGYLQEATAGS